jgi:prephenate dehydrogenase
MAKTQVVLTLIGLNRFSASLGLALRASNQDPESQLEFKIIGQDGDKAALAAAKKLGAVDEIESNAKSAVRYAHIVMVSLPAGLIEPLYEYFSSALKDGTVVLDMSLGKVSAIRLAETHFPHLPDGKPKAYLVGIQPLVKQDYLYATEGGVETARADLFTGGEMIIAPSSTCPPEAIKLAVDLASIIKMRHHFMEPGEYEALAHFTESLPLLLSLAFFAAIKDSKDLGRLANIGLGPLLNPLRQAQAEDILATWREQPALHQQHIDWLIALLGALREDIGQAAEGETAKRDLQNLLLAFGQWEARRASGDWEARTQVEVPRGLLASLFGMGNLGRRK